MNKKLIILTSLLYALNSYSMQNPAEDPQLDKELKAQIIIIASNSNNLENAFNQLKSYRTLNKEIKNEIDTQLVKENLLKLYLENKIYKDIDSFFQDYKTLLNLKNINLIKLFLILTKNYVNRLNSNQLSYIFIETIKVLEEHSYKLIYLFKNMNYNFNQPNKSLLHEASKYPIILEFILDNNSGIDIEQIPLWDFNGDNLLIRLIKQNNFKAFRLLLKHGANFNFANLDGETALSIAQNLSDRRFIEEINKYQS